MLALGVGTQFPDLVDKPLAWTFGVLPSGRSLAHSLVVFVLVAAVVRYLARNRGRLLEATAFLIGWLSHSLSDSFTILLGEQPCTAYLGWPFAACTYAEDHSFVEFFLALELTAGLKLGLGLAGLAVVVWVADGRPGLRYLSVRVGRWIGRRQRV